LKPGIGTRLIDSTPAQMNTSPAPAAIAPTAMWIDCHRRAAEAVDRGAGDRERQMRDEADQAAEIEALLGLWEGTAQDQVLDILGSTPLSATSLRSPGPPDRPAGYLARAPLVANWKGERRKWVMTAFGMKLLSPTFKSHPDLSG
jgi:hypothetical protein